MDIDEPLCLIYHNRHVLLDAVDELVILALGKYNSGEEASAADPEDHNGLNRGGEAKYKFFQIVNSSIQEELRFLQRRGKDMHLSG